MRIHPNKEIKMFVKKTGRFFAVTSMIVCCCCTATVFISYIKRSNIRMLCLGPFFLAAAIVLYIALKRCEKKLTKKRVRLIFAFFCLILLALQILFVRYLYYNYEMVDPKIQGSSQNALSWVKIWGASKKAIVFMLQNTLTHGA